MIIRRMPNSNIMAKNITMKEKIIDQSKRQITKVKDK